MSKSLRLSETWFRRGLWVVALVFASFLIGLGSTVVDDLPQVEQRVSLDDFIDQQQASPLRTQLDALQQAQRQALDERDQAELQWQQARSDTQTARDGFNSWIATRSATQRSEQDPEVIRRNQELEQLRQTERKAQQALQNQQQVLLNARQETARVNHELEALESAARDQFYAAQRAQELRVFLYRLALTLPLLALAGWLFVKKRKSTWWPFVWGFIFFALFAFFVELVPYLPSYGGYVRYAVGITITVLVGRWAIVALQRYLERQREAEALPATERRTQLTYDKAWTHLSKGVCPGCERHVDLKDGVTDYCPHCGIGLFEACHACQARTSSFAKFCFSCGSAAQHKATEG
ncbi:zinc ribbon domain-containing protein [Comamonas sp. NoAH]|uniref:zinc ribbon domain-containing protein n=1 Tax=Comamonas halotolerans TaxID=3041496 RepID=UPI0024E11CCB|nr:zinc ribbon domain-containing protein [Comamonas sp. NoAH]